MCAYICTYINIHRKENSEGDVASALGSLLTVLPVQASVHFKLRVCSVLSVSSVFRGNFVYIHT